MILANVLEHILGSTLSWRAPGCSCSLCPWQSSSESWQPWRYCKLNHKGIVSRKFDGEQIASSCYLLGINHRRFCLLSEDKKIRNKAIFLVASKAHVSLAS